MTQPSLRLVNGDTNPAGPGYREVEVGRSLAVGGPSATGGRVLYRGAWGKRLSD